MDSNTSIDNQQAKETLEMIRHTKEKTRKALSYCDTSPWLILWGSLWITAYTVCHFYLRYATLIFTTMVIIGGIGSGVIEWWSKTQGPLRNDAPNSLDRKIWWFWLALFVYIGIWLTLLFPFHGRQFNAVLVTAVMFAYVVMGLLYEMPLLVIIGVAVTAVTVFAYYTFPAYYCLWLAACGGGTLLGTGIYMRLKWR
jgi:hypothetical protein